MLLDVGADNLGVVQLERERRCREEDGMVVLRGTRRGQPIQLDQSLKIAL